MELAAKLLIGLIFVANFIQLIKRGPAGVKAWWRAKLFGEVPSGVKVAV